MEFELCVEGIEGALAARDGGADRIELCSALSEGGLTPGHALIREVVRRSRLPVHVMLRPRGGDFVYSEDEMDLIYADLEHARQLGASGFVTGFLRNDGSIDVDRTRQVVELAGLAEVTFHRAIDCAPDVSQALETVISTGCRRVLTSGGKRTVLEGAEVLATLVKQAGERIRIAAGGGLRLESATEVARTTRAREFHGSLRKGVKSAYACVPGDEPCTRWTIQTEDVRAMMKALLAGQRD